MDLPRRTVLTGCLGAGVGGILAGCSTGSDGTDTPTVTPDQLYGLTGSYEILAGAFRDLALDIDDPVVLDYTADVKSGPNIDVLVLARGEFREYERGNEFELITDASALDTSYGDTRTELDPTDVNVVFDNTDAGTAGPPESDGTVTVDFELTVTRQSK
jgi:hypothetical protein